MLVFSEMLYLIPEKCKPKTEFLKMDNKIFAYGYTAHQSWAFDKTLLDSNLRVYKSMAETSKSGILLEK